MPAHLLPLHEGPAIVLQDGCELTLGRSNILGLDGVRGVSKVHMTVRSCGDGFEVLDAGSRNGTFVNGERVEGAARVLAARDQITIGRSDARIGFVFELGLPGMAVEGDAGLEPVASNTAAVERLRTAEAALAAFKAEFRGTRGREPLHAEMKLERAYRDYRRLQRTAKRLGTKGGSGVDGGELGSAPEADIRTTSTIWR